MQDEPNQVKDYLFDYLAKSDEKIQKLISEEKFSEIIDDVITNCYDKIITIYNITITYFEFICI